MHTCSKTPMAHGIHLAGSGHAFCMFGLRPCIWATSGSLLHTCTGLCNCLSSVLPIKGCQYKQHGDQMSYLS